MRDGAVYTLVNMESATFRDTAHYAAASQLCASLIARPRVSPARQAGRAALGASLNKDVTAAIKRLLSYTLL